MSSILIEIDNKEQCLKITHKETMNGPAEIYLNSRSKYMLYQIVRLDRFKVVLLIPGSWSYNILEWNFQDYNVANIFQQKLTEAIDKYFIYLSVKLTDEKTREFTVFNIQDNRIILEQFCLQPSNLLTLTIVHSLDIKKEILLLSDNIPVYRHMCNDLNEAIRLLNLIQEQYIKYIGNDNLLKICS